MKNCRKRAGEVSDRIFDEKDPLIFDAIFIFYGKTNRIIFLLTGTVGNSSSFYVDFSNRDI